MTSIFEGQPLKTRPFPSKARVIWDLGIYRDTSIHPLPPPQMFTIETQNNLEGKSPFSTFPEKDAMRLFKMNFRN